MFDIDSIPCRAVRDPSQNSLSVPEILVSDQAHDADLIELIERFVGRLPQRITALEEALAGRDSEALSSVVHKLRGAAASYGFQPITDAAAILEEAVKTHRDLGELQPQLEALCDLCRRARATA